MLRGDGIWRGVESYRHSYNSMENYREKKQLLLPRWNAVNMPNFPHTIHTPPSHKKIEQKLVKNGEKIGNTPSQLLRSMAPKGAIFSPVKMPIGTSCIFITLIISRQLLLGIRAYPYTSLNTIFQLNITSNLLTSTCHNLLLYQ